MKFTGDADLQIIWALKSSQTPQHSKIYIFSSTRIRKSVSNLLFMLFNGLPSMMLYVWWALFAWIYDIMLFCVRFKRIQLDFSDMCIIFRSCRITRDKILLFFLSLHPFYGWINVWVGLRFFKEIFDKKIWLNSGILT